MTSVKHSLPELTGEVLREVKRRFAEEDWGGLRQSHHRVLATVPKEGITVTDLGDRLQMTKQAAGQFVSYLVDLGYLQTGGDADDKRLRRITRTAAGDAMVRRAAERLAELEAEWADAVGPHRYETMCAVLEEIGRLAARNVTGPDPR